MIYRTIELYSFIIKIKLVRNVILYNIDIYDQPSRMHRSPFRSRQKLDFWRGGGEGKGTSIYKF